jgi:hypothetical protein
MVFRWVFHFTRRAAWGGRKLMCWCLAFWQLYDSGGTQRACRAHPLPIKYPFEDGGVSTYERFFGQYRVQDSFGSTQCRVILDRIRKILWILIITTYTG